MHIYIHIYINCLGNITMIQTAKRFLLPPCSSLAPCPFAWVSTDLLFLYNHLYFPQCMNSSSLAYFSQHDHSHPFMLPCASVLHFCSAELFSTVWRCCSLSDPVVYIYIVEALDHGKQN